MAELCDLVVEAHGYMRWKKAKTITGDMSIIGSLWARKGWTDVLKDVRVVADTAGQRITYEPFTAPGLRSVYRPDAVAIETLDGKVVGQRTNPRQAFHDHTINTPWDELHLAYFSGYAMWNYLNTPFIFTLPGFVTEEIEPWNGSDGEHFRRLKVIFPDSVASHCREQVFYIDKSGLIARHDYTAEPSGGIPSSHFTSAYRDFDGLKVATKRRAHPRKPDGSADTSALAVAIDVRNIKLD